MRWETQPQSLSLEEEQMTWWGPMGCLVGNLFWRPGKLLMIPLLAFGWESVREKSRPVKSVKIDIHRRTAVLGSLRHGARYHISCVCQQTYLPSRHRWTLYSNLQMPSLWWRNTSPIWLDITSSLLFWWMRGGRLVQNQLRPGIWHFRLPQLSHMAIASSEPTYIHGDWRWIHLDGADPDNPDRVWGKSIKLQSCVHPSNSSRGSCYPVARANIGRAPLHYHAVTYKYMGRALEIRDANRRKRPDALLLCERIPGGSFLQIVAQFSETYR